MMRTRPSTPSPDGGLHRGGCLYLSRFFLLFMTVIFAAVALWPGDASLSDRVVFASSLSLVLGMMCMAPLIDLAEKIEIRRHCRARGLRVLEIDSTYGVHYVENQDKKYARWPDDFERDPAQE